MKKKLEKLIWRNDSTVFIFVGLLVWGGACLTVLNFLHGNIKLLLEI